MCEPRYDNIDKTFTGKCATAFVIARWMITQTWLQFSNLHCDNMHRNKLDVIFDLLANNHKLFSSLLKTKLIKKVSFKMSFLYLISWIF